MWKSPEAARELFLAGATRKTARRVLVDDYVYLAFRGPGRVA